MDNDLSYFLLLKYNFKTVKLTLKIYIVTYHRYSY